jgi:anti-anti-sigma factor
MANAEERGGRLTALDALGASLEDMAREIGNYALVAAVVIEAPASFGIEAASEVRDLIIELEEEKEVTAVVVDLSAVTSWDNAGLGVIVAAHNRLDRAGGWLRVAGASEAVTRLFATAGLTKILPMYATAAEALTAGEW